MQRTLARVNLNPSLRRIASEKRADSDYSVTLNNVKGLEACTPSDSLTNLEILRYAQNDRIVSFICSGAAR